MAGNLILRRIHMYLGLFLGPWIAMYALAVLSVNHRDLFMDPGEPAARFESESEQVYRAGFTADADLRTIADQILADLDLEGTYNVRQDKAAGTITIVRRDPFAPRRITYVPGEEKLTVERQLFHAVTFLSQLHHRAGFGSPLLIDRVWGLAVELVVVGLVFWALSGVWLWWQLTVTRAYGFACLLGGAGLFLFFLITI